MKRPVSYSIRRAGHLWAIHSDSEAAMVTGGVIVTGLSIGDARAYRDLLRLHKRTVDSAELDAVAPVVAHGAGDARPDFQEAHE
jgi:hypothetical protein